MSRGGRRVTVGFDRNTRMEDLEKIRLEADPYILSLFSKDGDGFKLQTGDRLTFVVTCGIDACSVSSCSRVLVSLRPHNAQLTDTQWEAVMKVPWPDPFGKLLQELCKQLNQPLDYKAITKIIGRNFEFADQTRVNMIFKTLGMTARLKAERPDGENDGSWVRRKFHLSEV